MSIQTLNDLGLSSGTPGPGAPILNTDIGSAVHNSEINFETDSVLFQEETLWRAKIDFSIYGFADFSLLRVLVSFAHPTIRLGLGLAELSLLARALE